MKPTELYKTIAITTFSVMLLFFFINLILYIGISIFDKQIPKGSLHYGKETIKKTYPDMTEKEMMDMLQETWYGPGSEYEQLTQFKRKPQQGQYMNIDKQGFRYVENQCQYPISKDNFNIFVFGGSTTFGYGVADKDTIPSRIQAKIEGSCAYNFGRGSYTNIQDMILFETLVLKEQIPDVVIFINLLNDYFYSELKYTSKLKDYFEGDNKLAYSLSSFPIMRLVNYGYREEVVIRSEEELREITLRYLSNKRMIEAISREYNITPYFVVQPIPNYKYNLSNHIVFQAHPDVLDIQITSKMGYEILEEYRTDDFIWLADMQEGRNENLYVDSVHYTAKFSDEIAEEIVNRIK